MSGEDTTQVRQTAGPVPVPSFSGAQELTDELTILAAEVTEVLGAEPRFAAGWQRLTRVAQNQRLAWVWFTPANHGFWLDCEPGRRLQLVAWSHATAQRAELTVRAQDALALLPSARQLVLDVVTDACLRQADK